MNKFVALKFSLLLFAPFLILLVFPMPLIPMQAFSGILLLLISLTTFGADVPLVDAILYCLWSFAPFLLIAFFIFLTGMFKHLQPKRFSARVLAMTTWLLFSILLFLLAGYFATMLFSVSMAVVDGGLSVLLPATLAAAIGITVVGQVLTIPWVWFVFRALKIN